MVSATVSVPLNRGRSEDVSGESETRDAVFENDQNNHVFLPSVNR